jgi:hypothetical protein
LENLSVSRKAVRVQVLRFKKENITQETLTSGSQSKFPLIYPLLSPPKLGGPENFIIQQKQKSVVFPHM